MSYNFHDDSILHAFVHIYTSKSIEIKKNLMGGTDSCDVNNGSAKTLLMKRCISSDYSISLEISSDRFSLFKSRDS